MKFLLSFFCIAVCTQYVYPETAVWRTTAGETAEASIVGFYGSIVYLEKGKRRTRVNIPYSYLDDASKIRATEWLRNHVAASEVGTPVELSDSPLSKFLNGNLVRFEEGKLVPFDFGSELEPEFYAFYFSARWCGPCRRFTPKLVAFYDAMRELGHNNFELIFVSSDSGSGEMKKYMNEDKMPWPAIKFGKKSHRLISRMQGNGIPCLVVTDRNGHILAHSYRGSEYIGPSAPKEMLGNFLANSRRIRESDFFSGEGN